MNQSRGGTILAVLGLLIALASLCVAILNYLAPFSPIGPSPLAQERAESYPEPRSSAESYQEPPSSMEGVPTYLAPTLRPTLQPVVARYLTEEAKPPPIPTDAPSVTPTTEPDSIELPQAGDVRTVMRGGVAVEQVYVPAGSFEMGSEDTCTENFERPAHFVTLDAFWIDRTEVTNAQYAACIADGACRPPISNRSYTRTRYYGRSTYDNYPVIWISWSDALDFSIWANGRLPTEAEWEYVARGPEGLTYPWGNEPPSCTLLNSDYCLGDTSEVGSYPDGASWVGALDMAGNVLEWVNDWFDRDYYEESPLENPTGPSSGEYKAVRGGMWGGTSQMVCRVWEPPEHRFEWVGFRVVQSASNPDS